MSINTKSRSRRLARHWKKVIIVAAGLAFLSPSAFFLALYLGFWIGRWTKGLRSKKAPVVQENPQ